MIKISVEVHSGAIRSRAVVRAESIERAVDIASAHYPGSEVRVLFPIDPEAFFGEDQPLDEQIQLEMPRGRRVKPEADSSSTVARAAQ